MVISNKSHEIRHFLEIVRSFVTFLTCRLCAHSCRLVTVIKCVGTDVSQFVLMKVWFYRYETSSEEATIGTNDE